MEGIFSWAENLYPVDDDIDNLSSVDCYSDKSGLYRFLAWKPEAKGNKEHRQRTTGVFTA